MTGFHRLKKISQTRVERLLYGESLAETAQKERRAARADSDAAAEAKAHMERARLLLQAQKTVQTPPTRKTGDRKMTVSLYSSIATGKREVVVQTNAQSLDLFISGLADALDVAISTTDPDERAEMLASVLRNAFPVAYAISGYKAERVSETRMLSCGAASPGDSNLLAHSRT